MRSRYEWVKKKKCKTLNILSYNDMATIEDAVLKVVK